MELQEQKQKKKRWSSKKETEEVGKIFTKTKLCLEKPFKKPLYKESPDFLHSCSENQLLKIVEN